MRELAENLVGQRFGRLVVIERDKERNTRKTYYYCRCDCGTVKSIRADSLKCGAIRSCGCLKLEQDRINLEANHSHKQSGTRLYEIWQGIKKRCYNPHEPRYARYGGRGVAVCDEWKNDFSAFYEWAVGSGYNDTLTIDRIDNDGDYCPNNCRWASQETQARNRSNNIKIMIGNSTRTLTEWCEIFDLNFEMIYARYKRNGFKGIDDLFNK